MENLTLPVSITQIGTGGVSFKKCIINYGGTKEQWDAIEMDVTTAFGDKEHRVDIKVIFNDGTEIVI